MVVEGKFSLPVWFMVLLITLGASATVGTVSAVTGYRWVGSSSGSSSSSSEGPGGVMTFSSTIFFTDWSGQGGSDYETRTTNSPLCISGMAVTIPEDPKTTGSDYLSYAFGKYSNEIITEQRANLETVRKSPGKVIISKTNENETQIYSWIDQYSRTLKISSNASGAVTNVRFSRMNMTDDSFTFEYLPTLYIGTNEYGRDTFIAGTANLAPGDYAAVQATGNGPVLIQTMEVNKYGSADPDRGLVIMEFRKEEFAEPMTITGRPGDTPSPTPVSTVKSEAPVTTSPIPATTTAPASMLPLIAGIGIAGVLCAMRMRR